MFSSVSVIISIDFLFYRYKQSFINPQIIQLSYTINKNMGPICSVEDRRTKLAVEFTTPMRQVFDNYKTIIDHVRTSTDFYDNLKTSVIGFWMNQQSFDRQDLNFLAV